MATKKMRCEHCGELIPTGARFCEACGTPVAKKSNEVKASARQSKPVREYEKHMITWKADLPLLTNTIIVRQLLFVLLASSLCVLIFILSLDAFEGNLTLAGALRYILITILILGGLSLLAVLVMLVFYGNRYEYQFSMDEIGVTSQTIGGTRKKNAIVNLLLVLSGKPGPAGAGLIGASRQSELVKWEKVESIRADPEKLEIVLRRKGRAIMLMRCTSDNYEEIVRRANEALGARLK